jgi:predicted DNA-binding ribbon-helix-helix protein
MPSTVIKRSIVVAGHKTSVSLEDSFWIGLKEIARDSHLTLSKLVNKVDTERVNANLSSALRVYVFQHFAEDKRTDAVKPTRCMRPFSSIGYGKSLCRVAGGNARRGWRMLAGRSWERPRGNSKKDEPGRRCRASGRASRRPSAQNFLRVGTNMRSLI